METGATALAYSRRLWSRPELRATRGSLPNSAGAYAWFVRPESLPPSTPTADCLKREGYILVYAGETGPTSNGLRRRVRAHHSRDAGHSNFRLALGTVLKEILRVRLSFESASDFQQGGEGRLNSWMDQNASVAWIETTDKKAAVSLQDEVIVIHRPILNIRERNHPFAAQLSELVNEQTATLSCPRCDLRWSQSSI
jgi:hypothetical protein